ncbi:MAG: hypothetical protein ACLFNI_07775 [Natronomonas sp.]
MEWTFRTVVRGFLLVGGLIYVAWGILDGTQVTLVVGIIAALLGAFGLWWEFSGR